MLLAEAVNVPAVTVRGVPVVVKVKVLAPVAKVVLELLRVKVPVDKLVEAVRVHVLLPVMFVAMFTVVAEQVMVPAVPVKVKVEYDTTLQVGDAFVYLTVFALVDASNVPEPENGLAWARLKVELAPCVQPPVRVRVVVTITVPALVLVTIFPEVPEVTAPLKVID